MSIFCTAYGTMHLFKEEQDQGLFDFFVEKPIKSDTLKKALQNGKIAIIRNSGIKLSFQELISFRSELSR